MKWPFILLLLATTCTEAQVKNVQTIVADSVLLTNCDDSTELILLNHTRGIPGFLYNNGKGRTVFKRPLTRISDTVYLVGTDTLKLRYGAWIQGGNQFRANGIIGTMDNNNLDLYSNHTMRARIDTLGNLLIGYTVPGGYKVDVNGSMRNWNYNVVTYGDGYDIQTLANGLISSTSSSLINFGNYGKIGVNKADLGLIPTGSLIIGGASPNRWTTLTDYNFNPVFVVDGNGKTTINGGYSGIGPGGKTGTGTNLNAFQFSINGSRGTGSGNTGDIVFSTDTTRASGSTIHTMVNRWWIKGDSGHLSNTSTPTSSMDVSAPNGYSQFRMRTMYTPTSSSDTNGNTGEFSWDGNYFYVKTATGWKRAALTTF